jgi:hypothetical protein
VDRNNFPDKARLSSAYLDRWLPYSKSHLDMSLGSMMALDSIFHPGSRLLFVDL